MFSRVKLYSFRLSLLASFLILKSKNFGIYFIQSSAVVGAFLIQVILIVKALSENHSSMSDLACRLQFQRDFSIGEILVYLYKSTNHLINGKSQLVKIQKKYSILFITTFQFWNIRSKYFICSVFVWIYWSSRK